MKKIEPNILWDEDFIDADYEKARIMTKGRPKKWTQKRRRTHHRAYTIMYRSTRYPSTGFMLRDVVGIQWHPGMKIKCHGDYIKSLLYIKGNRYTEWRTKPTCTTVRFHECIVDSKNNAINSTYSNTKLRRDQYDATNDNGYYAKLERALENADRDKRNRVEWCDHLKENIKKQRIARKLPLKKKKAVTYKSGLWGTLKSLYRIKLKRK